MTRLPFGADSPLDLLAVALPVGGLLGGVLVVAGLVRMYRHRHGTTDKTPTKETR